MINKHVVFNIQALVKTG